MAEAALQLDRVLPHSTDAEMAVLGAMLLDREAANTAVELLVSDSFYLERHQKLFQALAEIADAGLIGDPVVAQEELKKRGTLELVGGSAYLAELTAGTPTLANVERYCQIVRDKALARGLAEAAAGIHHFVLASDGTRAIELLDRAEQELYRLSTSRLTRDASDIRSILMQSFEQLEAAEREGGRMLGLPTGFADLDDLTGGLRRSDMIVVAGRPSMGKTSFALNLALHAALAERRGVLLFSAEMSRSDLALNLLCMHGRKDASKVRRGQLSAQEYGELTALAGELYEAPIYIDDTPAIQTVELRAKARRLRAKKDIRLIIVDYLQLLRSPTEAAESRQQEIAAISRALKATARELDVPLIAVSQLNRAPEGRSSHQPMLADLRESGAIEQDADLVLLLYRPEYYERNDPELTGLAAATLAKHRNGRTGVIGLRFEGQYLRFENLKTDALTEYQKKALF